MASLVGMDDVDRRLELAIDALLGERRPGTSICDLMPAARAAAGRLAAAGSVEVTQGGDLVDVASARGPVRVRRSR
jgi:crotonobetainyl-CoA:carnitine CoA-transferase CaiB-like acyl-CoA transferase